MDYFTLYFIIGLSITAFTVLFSLILGPRLLDLDESKQELTREFNENIPKLLILCFTITIVWPLILIISIRQYIKKHENST